VIEVSERSNEVIGPLDKGLVVQKHTADNGQNDSLKTLIRRLAGQGLDEKLGKALRGCREQRYHENRKMHAQNQRNHRGIEGNAALHEQIGGIEVQQATETDGRMNGCIGLMESSDE
jgi:hypothetical protein